MNTAPKEMAMSVVILVVIRSTGLPPAIWKKTRYVGALSRTPESRPVVQKNAAGEFKIFKNSALSSFRISL